MASAGAEVAGQYNFLKISKCQAFGVVRNHLVFHFFPHPVVQTRPWEGADRQAGGLVSFLQAGTQGPKGFLGKTLHLVGQKMRPTEPRVSTRGGNAESSGPRA